MKTRFGIFLCYLAMIVVGIMMTVQNAFAQAPSYLHVNTESNGAAEVALAARLNYEGVTVGITETTNPAKHDYSGFTSTVAAASRYGLRIYLRLNPAADRAGLPADWKQPYRLPIANAKNCADVYLSHAIDIVAVAYAGHLDRVKAELGNEADIGGANGAYIGRWSKLRSIYAQFKTAYSYWLSHKTSTNESKARALWDQVLPDSMWPRSGYAPAEGTIEPAYFEMVLAELQVLAPKYSWLKIYGPALEGVNGAVGQTELNSWRCTTGDTILGLLSGRIADNRYMSHRCNTNAQAGTYFASDLNAQLIRIHANSLMKCVFVSEMGISNTGLVPEIAAARQSELMTARGLRIDGASFYRCTEDDALSTGFGIAAPSTFAAIGKFLVGPWRG
jgi:hypothetical protein